MRSIPRFAAFVAVSLLLAACGDDPRPAVPAPVAGTSQAVPGVAPVVDWDPEDLKEVPLEHVAAPGSGTSFLEGVVVGPDGKPVPGATVEVHASARQYAAVPPLLHASAKAGPDGAFRVGPGPTPWRTQGILSASAPGLARTCLVSGARSTPGEPAADEGTPVRIALRPGFEVRGRVRTPDGGPPDEPVTIWTIGNAFMQVLNTDAAGDFSFIAPEGEVRVNALEGAHPSVGAAILVRSGQPAEVSLRVARGKDIRGRVIDAITGKPIEGAVLRGHYGETRLFRTDAKGEFLLPRFWFRAFQVRTPGYAVRSHVLSAYSGEPGADIETIRMHPGLVARGTVRDLDGRPIGGIRLRCHAKDPAGDWVDLPGPRSKPDGTYTFVGLPLPGEGREIRLFGEAYGFAPGASPPVSGAPMSVVDGVELRIPRIVEWEGRMQDEKGAPVEGIVKASWDPPPELTPYLLVLQPVSQTVSEASGKFVISVPERTRVRVESAGETFERGQAAGDTPAHPASAPDASRRPPAPVVLRVHRGLSVRGTVRDAKGGLVGRGEVRVEPNPPSDPRASRDVRVKPDGTFEAGGLQPGAYDFSVLVQPEFLQEVVRGVAAGAPPVDVRLRRPCTVRGRIVLPEEMSPQAPTEVVFRALGDSRPLPARHELTVRSPSGEFRLSPVSPGAYALTAVCGDARLDLETVAVVEDGISDLGDLVLKPGASAGGLVTGGGRPAPGTIVEVFRVGAEGKLLDGRRVAADAEGRWRVGGLQPGPHAVLARPRDRPLVEARFEAAAGEARTVDLAALAGGRVLVKVLDAAGAPVEGARVLFSGTAGSILFWREGDPGPGPHATGAGGTLACAGLAAGDLFVSADKPGAGAGQSPVAVMDGASVEVEVRLAK